MISVYNNKLQNVQNHAIFINKMLIV